MSYFGLINYVAAILLITAGLYIVLSSPNLVKTCWVDIFQTSAYLIFIAPGKFLECQSILTQFYDTQVRFSRFNLTANVVGVATLSHFLL